MARLISSIEHTNSPNSRKLQDLRSHLPFSALGKVQILVNHKGTKATFPLPSRLRNRTISEFSLRSVVAVPPS